MSSNLTIGSNLKNFDETDMRSRLKTNIKRQSIHTILGIVAILLFLVFFGADLIVGISVVLDKLRGQTQEVTKTGSVDYIAPPVLNPIPKATNKNSITISGHTSFSDVEIKLFLNGEDVSKTKPNSDNTFNFESISLTSGENEIKAKAINSDKKESDYSQSITISYLDEEPELEIKTPQDAQTFKKDQSPIRITGTTDKNVRVTINEFRAISQDDGTFYYLYNLKDGDNTISIVATDEAGNQTTKEIRIKAE